ncbi:hypothetical protein BD414DRAFT_513439 [Trametes punicea]|nr:hypothetical protein BD414DRAFT_513439 [Trametes punicea]
MQESKAVDVPRFAALRKFQTHAAKRIGFETTHHVTALNNEYYANKPAELFRLNLANPLVRPQMSLYPEVCGPVSEFFHAQKMLAMDNDTLDQGQLMWADWEHAPQRHFYIKELASVQDGRFVIPLRFITAAGIESFDGLEVAHDSATGTFRIQHDRMIREQTGNLHQNFLDLQVVGYQVNFHASSPAWVTEMPHPVRSIACGRPAITMRLMPWSDDVSGNRTKQYNAHTNVYIANANLPHAKLQQEYFYASSSEQMRVIADDTGPDNWHTGYDCLLEQEVVFRIIPHVLPADNPQQAEHCSHITGKGNHPCRRCEVGGTAAECEQDINYEEFFTGGLQRTVEKTVSHIREQLLAACLGVQETIESLQTKTGIKDKIAQHWIDILIPMARDMQQSRLHNVLTKDSRLREVHLRQDDRKAIREEIKKEIQTELFSWLVRQPAHAFAALPALSPLRADVRPGDHYNVLLVVSGIDVHQDTPCELLHTYLLGVDKYAWHKTNTEWDKKSEELFSMRLRASSIDGLTLTSVLGDYITRYPNSLLGKHFKVIQQLAVFQLYDGVCPPIIFDLWKAIGELGAMLWVHKIQSLDAYIEDLRILIANLLDIWAIINPARIIVKQKLHVLSHVLEDVQRHGPAILYSTEIFECWNTIFRHCSIHSNHHAASHDIARTLADTERFKHQVSGGWWPLAEEDLDSQALTTVGTKTYVRAGENVRTFLRKHPELQRRLGWVDPAILTPGKVAPQSVKKQHPAEWSVACGDHIVPLPTNYPGRSFSSSDAWIRCKHVIAQSQDVCRDGSWIFYRETGTSTLLVGHISRILCHVLTNTAVVVVDRFLVNADRDTYFNIASHLLLDSELRCNPSDIIFSFNAQHDCRKAQCKDHVDVAIVQERRHTGVMRKALVHKPEQRYLINMHALHNAARIRDILPRELTRPIPYVADRIAKHQEIAAALRIAGPLKQAQAKAKAAETRARNKELKENGKAALLLHGQHSGST